jgi:threonyl-tRNA synthetase
MVSNDKAQHSEEKLETMRHSASHVMAEAVQSLFPEAKFGIGPAIENGVYYDFELPRPLKPEDLPAIEAKMKEIIKRGVPFVKENISKDEARKLFKSQLYKLELIEDLQDGDITIYRNGEFVDLCAGPHVESTRKITLDGFKLDRIAGAYWRGSEKNPMLQRIYALAFRSRKELEEYSKQREEIKKRDHKVLGVQLGLFVFSELVGPGLPLYTFKGTAILKEIKNYSNQLQTEIGYQEVQTPNMNRAELFKVSGHYDKYKDNMFKVISHYSDEDYYLKPMNCPQHTQIYASTPRSYKDLPIRIADFAYLYRDEKTGELSGLARLRSFTQDDGHCFCLESQIKDEFKSVLSAIEKAMKTYEMNYKIRLSLWDPAKPEKYLGDAQTWDKAQKILEEILVESKIEFEVGVGEAAIYGPKMDLISRDSLGREWQISTIQLDFIMPQRFDLKYNDSDGKEKTPVMIHRAIVGSPERFFGILIEHYAGAFPIWLSPIQAVVIPVSDQYLDYARKIEAELKDSNVRIRVDDSSERMNQKIRQAQLEKVPCMIIVGEKEVTNSTVAVRLRTGQQMPPEPLAQFKEKMLAAIAHKVRDFEM